MKGISRYFIKILAIFAVFPLLTWGFVSNAESAPAKKAKAAVKAAETKEAYPGINAPWAEPKKANFKGEIVVGDASDLTGPSAKSCLQMSAGLADWFRYQNEYLGGVEGYKISADVVDTKFDSRLAVNAFNRLIDDGKVIIYSGPGYCLPASGEIANRRKVPTLGSSGAVTQALMTPAEAAKRDNYFFQMSPVVASRMDILVKFCMADWKKKGRTGVPKFGSYVCDTLDGHEAATAIRYYVKKEGAEFAIHTFYATSISDAKAQVTALKNAKVDYILNGPSGEQPLTVFALELARQITDSWKPIFAGHAAYGTAYMDLHDKAFEGHYTYQYCLEWADTNEPIIAAFHELNKRWYGEIKPRTFLYSAGVQAAIVICEAYKRGIKKYGNPKKIDGVKMRELLETFKNFDPMGLSGTITYTHDDHQGVTALRIAECKDKKLIPATGFVPADPLTPEQRDGKYWLKD